MSGDGAAGPAPLVPVPSPGQGKRNRFPEPAGTTGTAGLRFESLAAFLDRTAKLPSRTWLLDGLIPDSGRVFLVASPNAGKTWLALIVAKAASEARRPVRLVLAEGGARATGDRFRDLKFPPDADVEIAHLSEFEFDNATERKRLCEWLRSQDRPVLVFDPFVSHYRGDENATGEMNAARAHLEEFAKANPGALIVLTHHTSKDADRNGTRGMYAARGSSVLSAWADVQVNLTHEATGRGSRKVAFVATVEKDRDGERGARVRMVLSLIDGTLDREEIGSDGQDASDAIRELLKDGAARSGNEIADAIPMKRKRILEAIRQMKAQGELEEPARHKVRLAARAAEEGEQ